MPKQKTLVGEASLDGAGLFSGAPARLTLKPAEPDEGIVFVRKDLPGAPRIPADPDHVVETPRHTTIGVEGAQVHTVEHLLAALHGLGVQNALVEIDGPEVPAADGSALPFVRLIRQAGVKELDRDAQPIVVRDGIPADGEGGALCALPRDGALHVSYTLSYPGTPIGSQFYEIALTEEGFEREIAPARTFCLLEEARALQAQGLGKGGSTANALIVGPEGVIENTLRFPDEFVRHKILDLVGDLALAGAPIHGHVVAVGSGHAQNHALARSLRARRLLGTIGNGRFMGPEEIQRYLPHRPPFLLVDRIIELVPYKRAVGIKHLSIADPFFQGHFPGLPVMPGVLQVEAIAQVAGLILLVLPEYAGKLPILLALEEVRFRRPVVPGDTLLLEANMTRLRRRFGEVHGKASVAGEVAAETVFRFAILDRSEFGGGAR